MRNNAQYNFPKTFQNIARYAREFLLGLKPKVDVDKVSQLLSHFKQHRLINYQTYCDVFTYTCFLMNYWKAVRVFLDEADYIPKRVLDMGVGSGATTLAYLTWIEYTLGSIQGKCEVNLTLLDRDRKQIGVAKEILENIRPALKRTSFALRTAIMSANNIANLEGPFDVILMSHILTENQSAVSNLLKKATKALNPGGSIFIVERINDPIWETIKGAITNLPFESVWGDRMFLARNLPLVKAEGFPKIDILSTRYLVLRRFSCGHSERLILDYFKAWRKQSVKLVEKIFAQDAEYYENPFDNPYKGVDAIRKYWQSKVLIQKNPNPQILRVAYLGDDAIVEWKASFERGSQKFDLQGIMVLTINLEKMKIQKLIEYYRTKVTGGNTWPQFRLKSV